LPHLWTWPTYHPKQHPDPISRFSTIYWTDRLTHRETDRQTDGLGDITCTSICLCYVDCGDAVNKKA